MAGIRSASWPLSCFRVCGHVKLIFDEQAISLNLSIGNFGFAPHKREKFGWVPSHEVFPADAARRM